MKTLRASSKDDPETIRRFRKEAHFLESIESKYVARLLDFVTHERGMMLIMEYVEGRLLSDVFEQGPIGVEHAIRLGIDLASGVRDLHAAGITHRDLKPQNLILRPMANGGVRATIIDFGLSRFDRRPNEERRQRGNWVSDSLTGLTRSDSAMGSLPYMAPEQLLDARKAREPADIYALGVILYQAACGHVPLGGSAKEQAKKKIIEESPRLPLDRHDDVARGYADLCARALRRRPVERFASADEVLQELTRLAAASPATASLAIPVAAPSYDEGEPTTVRQPVASPSSPPQANGGGEAAALQQTLHAVMSGPRGGSGNAAAAPAPAPLPAAGAPPPAARHATTNAGASSRGDGGSGGVGGVPVLHDADRDDSVGGTARMPALATAGAAQALAQHGPAARARHSPAPPPTAMPTPAPMTTPLPVAGPLGPSGASAWSPSAPKLQAAAQPQAQRAAAATASQGAPVARSGGFRFGIAALLVLVGVVGGVLVHELIRLLMG